MRPRFVAVFVVLATGLAFAFLAGPAAAGPEFEGGGEPLVQLLADVESPGDVIQSGTTLPIRVRVVDQFGAPVAGATVGASTEGGTVTPAETVTDGGGLARFSFTTTVSATREIAIHFEVMAPGAISDRRELIVYAIPAPAPRPILTRSESVSAGIGVAAVLAALATTEFGKYGLFSVVIFPLYSRLRKEEVLDHFVRGQIYGYIMSHPGDHYNSLKDALKVTNGTLAHHLRTLEMQGFIKADRDGVYKRFYPVEMQIPREKGIRLSDLQHHILSMIRTDGGPTQGEIAGRLGVSQQTVSYNLRHLSREGLIRFEKAGRSTHYFPGDT